MKHVAFLLPFILLLLMSCANRQSEVKPPAVRGSVSLAGVDFSTSGAIPLGGEWEFYPGQLLEPAKTFHKTILSALTRQLVFTDN